MKLGDFHIEVLSEGRFEVFEDGHINRIPTTREEEVTDHSSHVGINPVLIRTGSANVLLDTGLGWGLDAGSENPDVSNIRTNLGIFGIKPEEITHVVFSHLHYDHMAGGSYTDSDCKVRPTFPNATYYVHIKEWEHALSQVNQTQELVEMDYLLDDFYRLIADNYVELLTESSTEIVDGIQVLWTGGHTPGHQVVRLQSKGEFGFYLGDVFPSKKHMRIFSNNKWDVDPTRTSVEKYDFFRQAHHKQALFFLYHSLYGGLGRLTRDQEEDRYVFKEIPL